MQGAISPILLGVYILNKMLLLILEQNSGTVQQNRLDHFRVIIHGHPATWLHIVHAVGKNVFK